MNKQRQTKIYDNLYTQINFLKKDHDYALKTIKQQKIDIKRFLSILIEKDIPIPEDMIDRYISKVPSLKEDEEELPFT
jgi:hypothetical protein